MSDERLRDLERRARAGEADAALAWAAALDRLGRPDDAYEALLPARGDRRVAAGLWARAQGWALGQARPLRRAPRVRWVAEPLPGEALLSVVPHPCGVVVAGPTGAVVLDPDTGAPQAALDGRPTAVVHDVALAVQRRRLVGWELATGRRVLDERLLGLAHRAQVAGELLVRCARGWLRVERLDDPRRAPSSGWQHALPTIVLGTTAVSGDRVVVWGKTLPRPGRPAPYEVRALDLDGQLVWTREGDGRVVGHGVGEGEVLLETPDRLALLDARGEERWGRDEPLLPRAAGPGVIVAQEGLREPRQHDLLWLDRATGEELGRATARWSARPAQARDVTVVDTGQHALRAAAGGGAALWELALPDRHGGIGRVWPAHGRVYVELGTRALACVDEG